jgi:hypothetical protein
MASEKRKLSLSKETLRTLSATALSQVAGGACYPSQYCQATVDRGCGANYTYDVYGQHYICAPTECQTSSNCGIQTSGFYTCFTCYGC